MNFSVEAYRPSRLGDVAEASERLVVATLGGCGVHEVALRLNTGFFRRGRHFWRRPTISLMSQAGGDVRPFKGELPAEFTDYFTDDVAKTHLPELLGCGADVLIADLTRDIHTGVVEIADHKFVIDPFEMRGLVDGLTPETLPDEAFGEIFGAARRVAWHRDWDEFFHYWRVAFARMMRAAAGAFGDIPILENYFTARVAADRNERREPNHVDAVNERLRSMYDFARRFPEARLIAIPERCFVSGAHVPWGGPTHTHYLEYAYFVHADLVQMAVSNDFDFLASKTLDHGLELARERDALLVARDALAARGEEATARAETLAADLSDARERAAALAAERNALATENHEVAAAAAALALARDEARSETRALALERDEARARADVYAEERDRALDALARATAERDIARAEAEGLLARREEAEALARAVMEERDAARAEAAALAAARDEASERARRLQAACENAEARIREFVTREEEAVTRLTALEAAEERGRAGFTLPGRRAAGA